MARTFSALPHGLFDASAYYEELYQQRQLHPQYRLRLEASRRRTNQPHVGLEASALRITRELAPLSIESTELWTKPPPRTVDVAAESRNRLWTGACVAVKKTVGLWTPSVESAAPAPATGLFSPAHQRPRMDYRSTEQEPAALAMVRVEKRSAGEVAALESGSLWRADSARETKSERNWLVLSTILVHKTADAVSTVTTTSVSTSTTASTSTTVTTTTATTPAAPIKSRLRSLSMLEKPSRSLFASSTPSIPAARSAAPALWTKPAAIPAAADQDVQTVSIIDVVPLALPIDIDTNRSQARKKKAARAAKALPMPVLKSSVPCDETAMMSTGQRFPGQSLWGTMAAAEKTKSTVVREKQEKHWLDELCRLVL